MHAMKISCPGCKKTYEIPQELIDAILQKYGQKAADPGATFFQEITAPATTPAVVAQVASEPRKPRSMVKMAMLVLTILWPIAVLWTTFTSFHNTMRGMIPSGLPGQFVSPTTGALGTEDSIVMTAFLAALVGWTVLWMLAMAFLGVIRLATRR